jgi:hypothetical protein
LEDGFFSLFPLSAYIHNPKYYVPGNINLTRITARLSTFNHHHIFFAFFLPPGGFSRLPWALLLGTGFVRDTVAKEKESKDGHVLAISTKTKRKATRLGHQRVGLYNLDTSGLAVLEAHYNGTPSNNRRF